MESSWTPAVFPLVGLAANKVIRDRYNRSFGFLYGGTSYEILEMRM
ncbi:MAG: hypothetical protein R6U98_02855 [Pirellulaceae bacterium]